MTSPSSFCCIVNKKSSIQCFSMLLSLSYQHLDANVGILCDIYSSDYIQNCLPN